jgi:hypothetical protein
MAQPIYKLFQVKFTEAWHQLSQDEQNKLIEQIDQALVAAGGKKVVECDAAWCSEQWPIWGVEQFPDLEAVQKHTQLLNGLNWSRYVDTMTSLGSEFPSG